MSVGILGLVIIFLSSESRTLVPCPVKKKKEKSRNITRGGLEHFGRGRDRVSFVA